MAAKAQKGLGRGLGALFTEPLPTEETKETEKSTVTLPIMKLEPNRSQPRQHFDEVTLSELAASIAENGLISPIAVRKMENGSYQIIAGERRWRACRQAGLSEVPVYILDVDDRRAAQLALIENLQREDLSPLEEARGYRSLMDNYGLSQEETALAVGKSRPAVTNAMRLLKLPESLQTLVEDGSLSAGHARALLALESEALQTKAAREIIEKQLSVRRTEALVKKLLQPEKPQPQTNALAVDYYKECEKDLSRRLSRKVTISHGKKKGKFEIEYYGEEDLQKLIELFDGLTAAK